jgi:hypothetical protein
MRRSIFVLAGAFCAFLPFVVRAATLTEVHGDVKVNQGSGFKRVLGPMELSPGDTVIVGLHGSAQLSYGGGCVFGVKPGAVVSVRAQSPCGVQSPTSVAEYLIGPTLAADVMAAGVLYAQKSRKDHPVSP